jgi:hypothetical protein
MVPSVKVLALKVNFAVSSEVKTMLRFLRCFPQVETLHVMMIVSCDPLFPPFTFLIFPLIVHFDFPQVSS